MKFIYFVLILLITLPISTVKAEDQLTPLSDFVTNISESLDQDKNINYIIYRCVGANIYALTRKEIIPEKTEILHSQNLDFYYELKRKMVPDANQDDLQEMKEKQMEIIKQYLFLETRINKETPQKFREFFTNDLATCFLFTQIMNDVVENKLGAS